MYSHLAEFIFTHPAAFLRAEPVVSGTYAVTRSLDPRRDPGTDFEGMPLSELPVFWKLCPMSDGGDVNWDPERWLRTLNPGGEVMLEEE